MTGAPGFPSADERDGEGSAELPLRYEDVTQDGRLVLTAMMQGLGASWRAVERKLGGLDAFRERGILPILSRLVIEGGAGPVSVFEPVLYAGAFRFARELGGERLFLNMWLEARAREGTTHGPRPREDAPRVVVGRLFAEHVVTRPFAPPGERKVTRLSVPGAPEVPEATHVFETAEALVGDGPLDDEGEVEFGLMHTDSNQHVNSLVYPRRFEEALVRRLAREGRPAKTIAARSVDLRWRKPFFAGEAARVAMRVAEAEAGGGVSAVGAFRPAGHEGGSPPRPSCAIALRMS